MSRSPYITRLNAGFTLVEMMVVEAVLQDIQLVEEEVVMMLHGMILILIGMELKGAEVLTIL